MLTLHSFDTDIPGSPSGVSQSAGRTGLGALFSGGTLDLNPPSSASCSPPCEEGVAISQNAVYGFANYSEFLSNPLLRFTGNYGIHGAVRHRGDGSFLVEVGWLGETIQSDPFYDVIMHAKTWHFVEIGIQFSSSVCLDAEDPTISHILFSATLSGFIGPVPLPTVTVSASFDLSTELAFLPELDNVQFVGNGARIIDDMYINDPATCGGALVFLGDLRVADDDSSYTQDTGELLLTQAVVEVLTQSDSQIVSTQQVIEIILRFQQSWNFAAHGPNPASVLRGVESAAL